MLGLLLVVMAGLVFAGPPPPGSLPAAAPPSTSAVGLMMVFVLLTYGGWNEAAYISAEVRGPRLNIARALVWSILIVTGLYVLVNLAYLRGRGLAGMAESKAVAADLIERSTGLGGARAVSLLVVIAAITSMNGTALTGARTAYALGREFSPFRPLGRWQARGDTPVNALLAQGGLALALVPLGAFMRKGFETMVEYTAPVFWLFFFLTGLSLFVLRRREPRVLRPFAVPLYPATPLVFCGTCLYLLYASLVHTGAGALVGMAVLAIGGAVLLLGRQGDF